MTQIYVDTCIISGLAKHDLKPAEQHATEVLAAFAKDSRVSLVASSVAREELEKVPLDVRQPHLSQYSLLGQLSSSCTSWLDPIGGAVIEHPIYQALTSLLPDRPDAEHIFQAYSSGVTTFITTDERTILANKDRIQGISGIRVMSPSEFIRGSNLTSACS